SPGHAPRLPGNGNSRQASSERARAVLTRVRGWRRTLSGVMRAWFLSADVDHGAGGLEESGLADVMAGFLSLHNLVDVAAQFRIGFAGAHVAVEVMLELREQAGANLAVR